MLIRLLAIAFVALTSSGCATNPVTGKSELSLVSEREEIQIGGQQYLPAQQMQGGRYLVDPALTTYVNEVGQRLAAVSDRALPYEFVVLNNSQPNAWALPGGKIAVNRGLLTSLNNEAELAAVLAHEIVHAAARHGAKSVERNLIFQGAVMLTAISVDDSDYSNYIVGGAQLGAQLLSQRYSRKAELEADQYGMQYMARAGYDPEAAVTLQEKFVELSKDKNRNWLTGLFASHPPSAERVRKNAEQLTFLKTDPVKDWEVGEARYRNRLAYLNSKQSAYDAFDQATTLLSTDETDVARSRVSQALRLEPREPRFHGLMADIRLDEGDYSAAINAYNEALARDDNYYEYYLGRGLSHSKLGNRAQARSDLEKSNNLLPTAIATNELGNLSLVDDNRQEAKNFFRQVMASRGPLRDSAKSSFVRLDLIDSPESYFHFEPAIEDGELVVIVTNNSGQGVSLVELAVTAAINGGQYSLRTATNFPVGARKVVKSNWQVADDDVISDLQTRIVRVEL